MFGVSEYGRHGTVNVRLREVKRIAQLHFARMIAPNHTFQLFDVDIAVLVVVHFSEERSKISPRSIDCARATHYRQYEDLGVRPCGGAVRNNER